MSFFRSNIPNFAELTLDLAELVTKSDRKKKDCTPFKFLPEHLEKFKQLKLAIKHSLPLYEVNFDKPIYTFSDASKRSISFVAFQLDIDDNKWFEDNSLTDAQKNEKVIAAVTTEGGPKKRFIFCSSRKLTKSERNYSVYKLELLSLSQGLLSARAIFSFANIKAFVDARSLLYVRMCRSSSEQIARISIFLSSFTIDLFHVPSDLNFLSDYLSRISYPEDDTEETEYSRLLTEKESSAIIKELTLPQTLVLPSELVNKILNQESVRVNLPEVKSRRKKLCKALPPKATCPNIKKQRKIKDFQIDLAPTAEVNAIDAEENDVENHLQDFVITTNIFRKGFISREDFILAQHSCAKLQEVISSGRPKTRVVEGIIGVDTKKRTGSQPLGSWKPIIPQKLLIHYSTSLHYDWYSFHHSAPSLLRKIKQKFYVLDGGVIKEAISGCWSCQTAMPSMDTKQNFALQRLPDRPRVHLAFDICGAVSEEASGFKYIFIAIDLFSNLVIGAAFKTKTAKDIITFFRLSVLNYSLIQKITTDGEISLLQCQEFNDFLQKYNISRIRTSWNSPESNGAAERVMATVKKSVRILTSCHGCWSDYLPYLIMSINNTTMTFGYSANQITYGDDFFPHNELLALDENLTNTQEYFFKLKEFVEAARRQHKRKKDLRIKSNLLYINKRRTKKDFKIGDVVLLQNLHLSAGRGLKMTGTPGVILEICKSGKSALVQSLSTNRILKYNFSYLKKVSKPVFSRLPDDWKRKIEEIAENDAQGLPSQGSTQTDSSENGESD